MSLKYSVLILLIVCFSCKNATETASESTPISIKAAQVREQNIKEYLTFNGVTQFQKKENIRSNVTGYVSQMNFKVGDKISSGQAFAYVRTKEQDALNEAIKIDSSLAKFSHPLRINSNASGSISILNVQKNDYIAEGDTLATVVTPNSLVVQVNVPYEYVNAINVGTVCEIMLQNNEVITAKISGKMPIIDTVAQSQTFLIALPNMDLPENLNVVVKTIYHEVSMALSIPHDALQTNELMTDFWVMKIIDDSMAIKATVIPKLRNDSLVQIESKTVKLNDWIVTEGSYQMQDSTLIKIQKQ